MDCLELTGRPRIDDGAVRQAHKNLHPRGANVGYHRRCGLKAILNPPAKCSPPSEASRGWCKRSARWEYRRVPSSPYKLRNVSAATTKRPLLAWARLACARPAGRLTKRRSEPEGGD